MNRALLPESIGRTRIIAVLRRLGIARVRDIAPVLRAAGIENLEVTMDGEEALESIRWLAAKGTRLVPGRYGPQARPRPLTKRELHSWCRRAAM